MTATQMTATTNVTTGNIPLASEPLKLFKDELRKRLNAELFDILCEMWNTSMDLLTVPSYN